MTTGYPQVNASPDADAKPLAGATAAGGMDSPVDNFWLIGGYAVGTLAFQALIAAVWWTIGGLGALRRINNSLSKFEDDIHHLDTRLSREQKVRASVAASDARKGPGDKEEAAALIAAAATTGFDERSRPSAAHLVR